MRGKILSGNKEVSFGNIRKAIILSFFLAALVAIILVAFIDFFIDKQENDAKIINLAGRQRMLVQKITKNIYALPTNSSLKTEINEDAEAWDRVHKALRSGSEELGIPKPENPKIDSLLLEISPYQEKIVRLAQQENLGMLSPGQHAALRKWEEGFLVRMESVVDAFQAEAETSINDLEYIVALLVTLYVLFVFGLYKIFVKPIVRMVWSLSDEKEHQERQSRSILENTSDLIWSIDSDYNLLAFNVAFSKNMSEESGTVPNLGENILKYPNKNLSRRKRLYDRALSGESFEMEFEVAQRGISIYYELSFHPIYGKDGGVSGCSIFRRDITQRVETYQELQKSVESLKEAQEIANVGNWSWDMTKNEITWSDQLYKVFGQDYQTFEANYEGLMEIIHPEDREAFNADVENCIENQELHDIVHRIVMRDGSVRYVHEKGRAYYDQNDRPIRMAGTTQDVTIRENAKNRIRKQYNELQNFVYIISHNLRSPIANLQALVDIIEPGNEELNTEILSNIGATVEALDRTVHDLNHTMSLKDVLEDTFEEVELGAILQDVEQLLAQDIAQCGAEIEYDLSKAPMAFGLKSYFSNILFNLVLNAITYRATERPPHIKVASRHTALGKVEISVVDNGKGMALDGEKRKKIFDMYGRLSGSSDGRGLGLYLVKTQVEAMKGSIDVESEPDKGSIFTILFAAPKTDLAQMDIV